MKSYSNSSRSPARSLAAVQVDRYLMERAPRGRPASTPPTYLPVITISRMLGIPTREISCLIGQEMGFTVFDREVLDAVAKDIRLSDRIVASLDERKQGALDSWIQGLVSMEGRVIDTATIYHAVCRVVRGISLHGSAVVIGRGANFILRGTSAFRVRLVAPADLRARSMAEGAFGGEPMSPSLARAEVKRHAAERRVIMKKFFRADIDDPLAYDAIFNLRTLDPAHAAGLIMAAYRKTTGSGTA
jgi:cytidylate kinase